MIHKLPLFVCRSTSLSMGCGVDVVGIFFLIKSSQTTAMVAPQATCVCVFVELWKCCMRLIDFSALDDLIIGI